VALLRSTRHVKCYLYGRKYAVLGNFSLTRFFSLTFPWLSKIPDISRFSRQVVTLHINQTGSVALHVTLFKSNAAGITVRCGQALTVMVRRALLKSVQSRCSLSRCRRYFDDTITSPFHDRRLSTTVAWHHTRTQSTSAQQTSPHTQCRVLLPGEFTGKKAKVSGFIYHSCSSTSHSTHSGTDHTVLPAN